MNMGITNPWLELSISSVFSPFRSHSWCFLGDGNPRHHTRNTALDELYKAIHDVYILNLNGY